MLPAHILVLSAFSSDSKEHFALSYFTTTQDSAKG